MQLADRVYAIIGTDTPTGYEGAVESVATKPVHHPDLSEWEQDLRDWGLVYGLAYGIARGEDPYEPAHKVAERALEAADVAWRRWSRWHERPTLVPEAVS